MNGGGIVIVCIAIREAQHVALTLLDLVLAEDMRRGSRRAGPRPGMRCLGAREERLQIIILDREPKHERLLSRRKPDDRTAHRRELMLFRPVHDLGVASGQEPPKDQRFARGMHDATMELQQPRPTVRVPGADRDRPPPA